MLKFLLLFFLSASCAYSAEIQRADLDASERLFNNAYVHFMRRDYRDAQTYLDYAIQNNTYMVDYYLLSALNLNRMGDSEGSVEAIMNYLEVRPMDVSAPRIMNVMNEQNDVLRAVMGTAPVPERLRFSQTTVQNEWKTGYTRPFNIKGLGKIKSLGNTVCIPDTLGNVLYIRQNDSSGIFTRNSPLTNFQIQGPVISIPMGDGTFTIFCSNGDVYTLKNSELEQYISLPELVIADSEFISENFFVIANPAERCLAFYNLRGSTPLVRKWSPPEGDGDFLFEPVAVESFADWVAVADIANSRIYILNIMNFEFFTIKAVSKPRDLAWSSLGELFVLSDEGNVYNFIIDFGTRTYANRNSGPLYENINNVWTFFKSPEGDINFMDMGASNIFKTVIMPSRDDVPGFLSLYNPVIVSDVENRESFIVDASFMTPFVHYSLNTPVIAQAVWNNRNMRCSVLLQKPRNFDALFIHAPFPSGHTFPINVRPAQISSATDIHTVIPSFWLLHNDSLTNIIADSSINFSQNDLMTLLKFCLLNGLELDIFARDIPSLALTRASAFTGGHVIYAMNGTIELPTRNTHMKIQIPLPEELSTSGYPGRSMLAVYFDAGLIQSRSWIPLWPDMFTH